jgi:Ca2+-binding RTX toxin-like protein
MGVDHVATNNFTGIDNGDKWESQTISYTFDLPDDTIYDHINADQITATQAVIAQMEAITQLTFVYNATPTDENPVNFYFVTTNLGGSVVGRVSNFPSEADQIFIALDDEVDTTDTDDVQRSLTEGYGGFKTALHELGHALGLKHPHHEARARETDDFTLLKHNEDNNNATVMSYDDAESGSVGGAIATAHEGPTSPQTYMLYDVALLQQKYGANHGYMAGDDTYLFDGTARVFTIWDGAGNDTIDVTGSTEGTTIDLREGLENVSSISATHFWIAFNANIENAIGSSGDDDINGNDLANSLSGNEGEDTINGDTGDDTISGGIGNDTLNGQDDADSILGGSGNDEISGGNANDTLFGESDDDTITGGSGDDSIFGGEQSDSIKGDGGNDHIDGNEGDDTISGGIGNDTLRGGTGADLFIISAAVGAADNIIDFTADEDILDLTAFNNVYSLGDISITQEDTSTVLTFADSQTLTLQNFVKENLSEDYTRTNDVPPPPPPNPPSTGGNNSTPQLTEPTGGAASTAETLGSNDGDEINATVTGDRIKGLGGNDTLNGDQGDDFINGNLGNDTITGGAGNDSLRGGKGLDTLDAGSGDDHVNGNLGNDVLFGSSGNNTLHGGKDDDTINGGSGNELIKGDLGNDSIMGNNGNDTIYGRSGADTLAGNNGNDVFAFQASSDSTADTQDIIVDFTQGQDKIDVSALGILDVLELSSTITNNTVIEHQGSDFQFTLNGAHNLTSDDFIFAP